MATSADFRIEEVTQANVNNRPCIMFKAFKKDGEAFVFAGQFTAPPRTPKRDLWKFAEQAEDMP